VQNTFFPEAPEVVLVPDPASYSLTVRVVRKIRVPAHVNESSTGTGFVHVHGDRGDQPTRSLSRPPAGTVPVGYGRLGLSTGTGRERGTD
jgi:hypothetical protein